MKKLLLIVVLMLSACGPDLMTPEQRQKIIEEQRAERINKAKLRVEKLNQQFHACDKNDGVADIQSVNCFKGGCSSILVTCKDGMQREFER